MATSAFKSTTKRTPIGANSGSGDSSHRRSRSLCRPPPVSGETPRRSGKFVNTTRGSGLPSEISLDDLAIEFFSLQSSSDERERSRLTRRLSEANSASAARRRGRSVSRQMTRGSDGKRNPPPNGGAGGGGRRRSVSVVRCPTSDYESDRDHSQKSSSLANVKGSSGGKREVSSAQKPTALNHRRLGRSLSQKDLSWVHDGYSSHSSALTDDEARDGHSSKNIKEKTIRTVYAQKKSDHPIGDDVNSGLYDAMRMELRHAVDEIKTEIEQAVVSKNAASEHSNHLHSNTSKIIQPASTNRKHPATKSGKIDKRKDDILAEFLLEEQRRREPSSAEKPTRTRKKSKDRIRLSSRLAEEAEKYFEDFFSNFEDTDISSFDGERSETSSTFGPTRSGGEIFNSREMESFHSPAVPNLHSADMEGVVLPWLQWETSNDGSPHSLKTKRDLPVTPKSILWDVSEVMASAPDPSSHSTSSSGSWNPEISQGPDTTKEPRSMPIDMDRYLELKKDEELLWDTWRDRHRINSGVLLLCSSFLI